MIYSEVTRFCFRFDIALISSGWFEVELELGLDYGHCSHSRAAN